ncbi:CbiQ family ECF transporter T component [Deferribacter abyssi]|uniref:CbiQ family ECF transporter T component n=1 Tax=Deferribacter abyssi TaxID=213806 RepID=UPI003C142147
MNFNFLFLSIIFYTFTIAFKINFFIIDILPIFILAFLNIRKIKLFKFLIYLMKLNIFIFFLMITVYIFHRDTSFIKLIFIRVNLITIFNLFIILSHQKHEIFCSMVHLKIPWKLKALLIFSFKYIDIFSSEKDKLLETLKIRNFKAKTNLLTYKTMASIIGALIHRAFLKAQTLQDALIIKNFNGKFYSLSKSSTNLSDYLLLIATFTIFIYNIFGYKI